MHVYINCNWQTFFLSTLLLNVKWDSIKDTEDSDYFLLIITTYLIPGDRTYNLSIARCCSVEIGLKFTLH